MNAADARRFVAEQDLGEHVAKIAADAGPLSDEQRVVLRGILFANAETASPHKLAATITDHRTTPDDLGG